MHYRADKPETGNCIGAAELGTAALVIPFIIIILHYGISLPPCIKLAEAFPRLALPPHLGSCYPKVTCIMFIFHVIEFRAPPEVAHIC
jgi:hypothetical protein